MNHTTAMMRGAIALALTLICTAGALGAPREAVDVAIIRTAGRLAPEYMLYEGGGRAKAEIVYSAVLVRHGDQAFLFDTGLGAHIDAQFKTDMPTWKRPFFQYGRPVLPAQAQLAKAGFPPIRRILLSHSHWDHASGLADFPKVEIWVAPPERALVSQSNRGGGNTWASQVGDPRLNWKTIDFRSGPYLGFARSLDLYGDGSVVLVPQSGHTAGSVGMFVTTSSGRRLFFCGDTVWSAKALDTGRPKFWLARAMVDADARETLAQVRKMVALRRAEPGLTIVPAHDGAVQSALGFFPSWIH